MPTYDVAFIGTGDEAYLDDPEPDGFAMNYYHAEAYAALDNCTLHACADLVPENADAFAERFGIDDEHVYQDYEKMLAEASPNVVSISVRPSIHADLVVDCARADSVEAIHCEKPMDLTWGGSRRMAQVCRDEGVQLTFNHMRRFKPTWVEARDLVRSGEIGEIERVELSPRNIYDTGTHLIDFATDLVGDCSAEWVIGQIDYREENRWFGAHNENQAYGLWEYENGVKGVVSTGRGADLVPAELRVIGSEGVLDVAPDDESDGNTLRWRRDGDDAWERRTVTEGRWTDPIDDAIAHVVECLESGAEPSIGADNALITTEIIFGIWESARRRGRVDFPLQIEDNPLHEMVDSGALDPKPSEE